MGRSGYFRVADDSGITLPCGYLGVYRYRLKRGAGIQVDMLLAGLDSLNCGSFDQAANTHCNTIGQSEYAPADIGAP